MTPAERALVVPVCEVLGIPWVDEPRRHEPWHGWNGASLNLSERQEVSSVIHEIAHWMVAPPVRRHLPDFGLGALPAGASRAEWFPRGSHYSDDEEALASLLGILMERRLGLPWQETWGFHNWSDSHWGWLRKYFRELQQVGLLVGLTPTVFLLPTLQAGRA